MKRARPDFADSILKLLYARQAEAIDIDILQPADPFLDMAGEDLRRRIFMTENENGDSLCLRPEFTIPVSIQYMARETQKTARYAYCGEVFRQRRDGENAFYQAGIEDFGDGDEAHADARSLTDALAALVLVAPQIDMDIVVGDQTVFEAVLAALGLPKGWQKKLARAFGNDELLRSLLADLSAPKQESTLPEFLAGFVTTGDELALSQALEAEMREAGISPAASRSPLEIARRMIEKRALSTIRLSDQVITAVKDFLAINCALDKAEAVLCDFADRNGLDVDAILKTFIRRNKAFENMGIDLSMVQYDAAFGRPLDYYTGLVYEIRDGAQVIVGGGRYDRLLTMLGSQTEIPAVGFSIWLDRIGDNIFIDAKDGAS